VLPGTLGVVQVAGASALLAGPAEVDATSSALAETLNMRVSERLARLEDPGRA
jgi:hypothetical protein